LVDEQLPLGMDERPLFPRGVRSDGEDAHCALMLAEAGFDLLHTP
jgi:hypothetical protein